MIRVQTAASCAWRPQACRPITTSARTVARNRKGVQWLVYWNEMVDMGWAPVVTMVKSLSFGPPR